MDFSLNSGFSYFAFFIAICSLIQIFNYFNNIKRTNALELIALNLGFSFSKSARDSTKSKFECLQLFTKGVNRTFKNEMWRIDGENHVSIFGYSYDEGEEEFDQTVILIECKYFSFPKFELKPKTTFHKISQLFGFEGVNIELESYPKFSKKYNLKGYDEHKIRKLFTLKVVRFFESKYNYCVEASGSTLIFYRPSEKYEPLEIPKIYSDGQKIFTLLMNPSGV
jgi:hypothetical protein